jgi:pimeloyl-ACP methyl ester carboxylesterase
LDIKAYNIKNNDNDTLAFYLATNNNKLSDKLLVMVQGSGRNSIKRRFGWGAEAATLGYDILYLEKFAYNDSLLFVKSDCRERRLNDIHFVINYVTKNIYKNKLVEIFIIADSEGGALVPELAYNNKKVRRAIILSSGGFEQARQFKLLLNKENEGNYKGFLSLNGISSQSDLEKQFKIIKDNPSENKLWLGHSYKYWNSYLWYNPDNIIDSLTIPILILIGDKDRYVPVESVKYLQKKYKYKTNITIKILKGLDHQYKDSKGNRQFSKVLKDIILPWYKSTS